MLLFKASVLGDDGQRFLALPVDWAIGGHHFRKHDQQVATADIVTKVNQDNVRQGFGRVNDDTKRRGKPFISGNNLVALLGQPKHMGFLQKTRGELLDDRLSDNAGRTSG